MDELIERLLNYWFGRTPETKTQLDERFERWFAASAETDADVSFRFGDAARLAARGELDDLGRTARGRLALILLLDQAPRHLHRRTKAAFDQDAKALALARAGIEAGMDRELPVLQRAFFYMPLQHSESLEAQELSVRKLEELRRDGEEEELLRPVLQGFLDYARLHRDIVLRFGRFPHRNRQLGRPDTPEEQEFLAGGAVRFGQ